MFLAAGWSDVVNTGEIAVAIGSFLIWALSHPGTYMVLGGILLMGLTLWASAKKDGAFSKFKVASYIGVGATGISVVLVTVGILNLTGLIGLKDTVEKSHGSSKGTRHSPGQEISPGAGVPGDSGGATPVEPPASG